MNKKNIYDEIENIDIEGLFSVELVKSEKQIEEMPEEVSRDLAKESLYEKTLECPVCYKQFKTKSTRSSKVKYISSEMDLKPIYQPVQPAYYDVIICSNCGYAAISTKFSSISESQGERILKLITPKFVPKEYPEIYDANTALERYKLALICAIQKNAKQGEKAYICLKIAWIYRDLEDKGNEAKYIKAAYDGFKLAYGKDTFPICGLDEMTLIYMLAVFAKRLGDSDEARRYLSRVVTSRTPNPRLKDKALQLKQELTNT